MFKLIIKNDISYLRLLFFLVAIDTVTSNTIAALLVGLSALYDLFKQRKSRKYHVPCRTVAALYGTS